MHAASRRARSLQSQATGCVGGEGEERVWRGYMSLITQVCVCFSAAAAPMDTTGEICLQVILVGKLFCDQLQVCHQGNSTMW